MNPMNPESTPSIQERLIDELLREPLFDGDSVFVKELQQQLEAAFLPTVKTIRKAPVTSPLSEIDVSGAIKLFVELTQV